MDASVTRSEREREIIMHIISTAEKMWNTMHINAVDHVIINICTDGIFTIHDMKQVTIIQSGEHKLPK